MKDRKSIVQMREVVQQFQCSGLKCAVVVNPFGGCNGYVQLPVKHPKEWANGDKIPVTAHGGITYGPDAGRWIGFDTLHLGDYWGGDRRGKAHPSLLDERGEDNSIEWNEDKVADECRRIARKLRAILNPTK